MKKKSVKKLTEVTHKTFDKDSQKEPTIEEWLEIAWDSYPVMLIAKKITAYNDEELEQFISGIDEKANNEVLNALSVNAYWYKNGEQTHGIALARLESTLSKLVKRTSRMH